MSVVQQYVQHEEHHLIKPQCFISMKMFGPEQPHDEELKFREWQTPTLKHFTYKSGEFSEMSQNSR